MRSGSRRNARQRTPRLEPWLVAELRAVAVPRGLARRLRRIAAFPPEQIDALLCGPDIPYRLTHRLHAISAGRPWWSAVRQWTIVAAFLAALWLGYAGAMLQLASYASARRATLPGHWTPISRMLPPAIANLPAAPPRAS